MLSIFRFIGGMLYEFFKRLVGFTLRALHYLRYVFFVAVLGFLAFAFLFALFLAPYTVAPNYSVFNEGWDGLSAFYSIASRHSTTKAVYVSLDDLSALGRDSTLVIVAPERAYAAKERSLLREFVSRGGTLIICDAEGGYGAEIASEFRLKYGNATVVDYLSFYKRQDFPVTPFVVGGQSGWVHLKFPTNVMNYPQDAVILASTSPESYLDVNKNLAIDEGDLKGPFAVAVEENYGNGSVVAISDADVFTNDLIARGDNVLFADAVLARYGDGLVLFDETHRFGEREEALIYLFTYRSKLQEISFVLLVATVIAGFLLLAQRLWVGVESRKVEAQRDLKLHTYKDLVWDIAANARLRAEPYTWIVLMQYDRFRDKLLRIVDPFRKPITNEELAKKVSKKAGWDESDLYGLLERLESIKTGASGVKSLDESTALCRIMDGYLEKLKNVK